mgnify:CR=1 FL=1
MKRALLSIICLLAVIASTFASFKGTAKWISAPDCAHTANTWQIFRKSFTLDKRPDEAVAYIAADSKYWLWINGKLAVFEGSLKRGPAASDHYCDIVDIADYLKKGENSIAVLTWFFGKGGFSHHNSGKGGLYFDAQIDEQTIKSDDSWKAQVYTAYQNPCILCG